jgi:hypothetical protein
MPYAPRTFVFILVHFYVFDLHDELLLLTFPQIRFLYGRLFHVLRIHTYFLVFGISAPYCLHFMGNAFVIVSFLILLSCLHAASWRLWRLFVHIGLCDTSLFVIFVVVFFLFLQSICQFDVSYSSAVFSWVQLWPKHLGLINQLWPIDRLLFEGSCAADMASDCQDTF